MDLGTAAIWIMGLAESLPVFILGMLLYGVTNFVSSPLNSYITVARGRWSIGRVFTFISASFNIGMILGPWLGGWIGEQFGLRQNFFVAAGLLMASTPFILFIRPQLVDKPTRGDASEPLLQNTRFLIYLVTLFLVMFALYLTQPLSPNFLQNERTLDLGQIGQLYSLSGIGVVILNLTLGRLRTRTGFMLAQISVLMFSLFLWLGNHIFWYSIGYFLLGGFKSARSLGSAFTREFAPQAKMGLAFGLSETISSFGLLLAPLLAGYLYSKNPSWMYTTSVGLILLSLIVSFQFLPATSKLGVVSIDASPRAHSLDENPSGYPEK
jgi:DHA1 family tetracycline resistance protein-like MFS transporter